MTRIPIKYARPFTAILRITGAPPSTAYLDVDGERVRARMGRSFRAEFPRDAITSVDEFRHVVSVGVHGWRGRWIVNGAHAPMACIVLKTPVRARVLGVPVRLRELCVSVDDIAELKRVLLG